MKKIAITGPIAAGKSSVVNILKAKGYKILEADNIYHDLLEEGGFTNDLVKLFGQACLNKEGLPDRKKIGEIIFRDPNKKKMLDKITHPAIYSKMFEDYNLLQEEGVYDRNLVFFDIPLLFEDMKSDRVKNFDSIWLVMISKEIQIERLMNRNKISRQQATLRIEAQASVEDAIQIADIILYNDEDAGNLERQVCQAIKSEEE